MANIIDFTDKYPLAHKTIKIGKIPVGIKTYLDVDTFATMANTLANSCFDKDTNVYRPEYYDIAKRYVVLKYLTDIDFGDMGVGEIFKVAQSDWYYEIEKACAVLAYEVESAADKIIAYRLSNRKTAFDNLCDNLSAIFKQDNTKNLADIKEVLNKLDGIDKNAFVKAVVENNLAKNRGEDNGEKLKGATK